MAFVKTEVQGAVEIITIDRPKALNALNPEVLADLKAAVEAGQTAASRIGEVVSALVIPRPHASVSECMPELRCALR